MPNTYNIDEILALPSSIEVVSRLCEELTKSAPHRNDAEKAILAAEEWDGYISGDGIMEWLDTHSALPIAWFRNALELLGASKHLAIIDRALTVFPNSTPPEDYEKYRDTVFDLSKEQRQMIEDCTEQYYAANREEDIYELIHQFVVRNIDQFR